MVKTRVCCKFVREAKLYLSVLHYPSAIFDLKLSQDDTCLKFTLFQLGCLPCSYLSKLEKKAAASKLLSSFIYLAKLAWNWIHNSPALSASFARVEIESRKLHDTAGAELNNASSELVTKLRRCVCRHHTGRMVANLFTPRLSIIYAKSAAS